jgi:hypothetical protein
MANVIASGTTVANGSIKKNNFIIGVNTSIGYGPTSATTFWNGIIPPTSGYTVYAQKSVGGPSVRTATNDSELITIAKQYSGTNINTINDALSYLNSQSNFLVTNIDYPNIVTSGLTVIIDAGYVPSYPRTGTTWNDLSGNGNNGTLQNSPTYSSNNGGIINFNGTNNTATFTATLNSVGMYQNSFSNEFWFNASSITQGALLSANGSPVAGGQYAIVLRTNQIYVSYYGEDQGVPLSANTWYNFTNTYNYTTKSSLMYLNGVLSSTLTRTVDLGASVQNSPLLIGNYSFGGSYFNGSMSSLQIYNRVLSQTEITQNYNALKSRFGL